MPQGSKLARLLATAMFVVAWLFTGSAHAEAPMCGDLGQSIEAPPIHMAARQVTLAAPASCASDGWSISPVSPIQPRGVTKAAPSGNDQGVFGPAMSARPMAGPWLPVEAALEELSPLGFGSRLERPPRAQG